MDRLKVDDSSFLLKGGNYVLSYAISTHKPFTQDCLLSHDTQYIQWQYKSWINERGGACSNHCRALNVVCSVYLLPINKLIEKLTNEIWSSSFSARYSVCLTLVFVMVASIFRKLPTGRHLQRLQGGRHYSEVFFSELSMVDLTYAGKKLFWDSNIGSHHY